MTDAHSIPTGRHVYTNDLPHQTAFVENIFITLSDHTRLAARVLAPVEVTRYVEAAQGGGKLPTLSGQYPAVLEYIPYRKRDGTRTRDEPMHGFFAGQGFVSVRVDMRGAGESDGLMHDEYLKIEQDDALEVIDWISKQAWCNGHVGMMGKSWSGFNSLQVAARRPPALKAIIVLGFTGNRFTDDIHWKGGCLLNDNFWWGCIMQAFMARPPDSAIVGDRWKDMWLERLEQMPFNAADWASHQTYDAYWKHGSICEDFASIQVPVLMIEGWADSYTNALFHLMEHLQVPKKAICGPWVHAYPQDGVPLPQMNFLREATTWWNAWLRPESKPNVEELCSPAVQCYVEDALPPCTSKPVAPGKWVSLSSWPSPDVAEASYYLAPHRHLSTERAVVETEVMVHTPLNHGLLSGEWMGAGVLGETAGDQRLDNGLAVTFTSVALTTPMDILGQPTFTVSVKCDQPKGFLFAQLCDVAPDGSATRITYGLKNLVHCGPQGNEAVALLQPGVPVTATIAMDYCGYCVPAGHSLSLSLANNYWPMVWNSPADTTLTLDGASALLSVPHLRPETMKVVAGPDPIPEVAAPTPVTVLKEGYVDRSVSYDIVRDAWTCVTNGVGGVFGEGVYRFDDIDTTVEHNLKRELVLCNKNPLSASYTITQMMKLSRPGWVTEVELVSTQTGDQDYLYLHSTIAASYNGEAAFEKNWYRRVLREAI